jgi:hypothetical protein
VRGEEGGFRGRQRAPVEHWVIITKYAARNARGKVLRCEPLPGEARLAYSERYGLVRSNGKIIYRSEADAQQAAREMEALGTNPQKVYVCGRDGHPHLTSELTR